jgi:hypothetical protein
VALPILDVVRPSDPVTAHSTKSRAPPVIEWQSTRGYSRVDRSVGEALEIRPHCQRQP